MVIETGRTFAVLTLAGLGGYFTCLARHWCQCGHMEHPPYGLSVVCYKLPATLALSVQSVWLLDSSFRLKHPPLDNYDS